MTTIKNTTARASIISKIDDAHTKARKTTRGPSPMRGALVFVTNQRKLTLVGGGPSVKFIGASLADDCNSDRFCFYEANGVLAHEEVATVELNNWFNSQIVRA